MKELDFFSLEQPHHVAQVQPIAPDRVDRLLQDSTHIDELHQLVTDL